MAEFLCKKCKSGVVNKIEGSEIERGWCSITKQYQTGKVIECSAFVPAKVLQLKKGK